MFKLIPIMCFALLMAYLIQKREYNLRYRQDQLVYDKVFTIILILGLGIFTGLRTFCNDTATYIQIYNYGTPELSVYLSEWEMDFSEPFGFGFVNSLLKTLGASSQDFIMVYGLATITLYITFLRRRSESFTFSMYLFFVFFGFIFAQAAIKQSMAMAIGCWSFHFATKNEWEKFGCTVLLASLFHPVAVIYLIMPLMRFRPWSSQCFLWIIGLVIAGISMTSLIGAILEVTSFMGASYDRDSFSGAGVNIFRVLVCLVPTMLSYVFRYNLYKEADEADYLMMNLTMLNGLIMFVGLFGTANYFARLANMFAPMTLISLPWLINRTSESNQKVLKVSAVICYFLFCFYENGILRPFDTGFAQISLWEYIKGLFT